MTRCFFRCYAPLTLGLLAFVCASRGQQPPNSSKNGDDVHASYVLGPDDQIVIRALDPEETTDKPVRIDMNGYIRLPMVGRVKAAGLTADQLEQSLDDSLKPYLVHPDVSVFVTEFRSQPVSVMGEVKTPGVIQLQGHKTLTEVLSMAGGTNPDAGHSVLITRQRAEGLLPLPNATIDSTGEYYVAEISLNDIMDAKHPAENIVIRPDDVITVPRGEMVYVVGMVMHPGGFVLREKQSLSVLQALAVAGGLNRGAAPQKACILRTVAGETNRHKIPVDMKKIQEGRSEDLALRSDDILLIPDSKSKEAFLKGGEAALQIVTGLLIFRL